MSVVCRAPWCAAYWAIAVRILMNVSPVYMDGSGPMPSFYWAREPVPDIGNYNRHRAFYDAFYARPYYLAASAIAIAGCIVAPYLAAKLRRSSSGVFANTAGLTLALMLLLAIGCDVGARHRWWESPLFLLHGGWWGYGVYDIYVMCKLFVPLPLPTGLGDAVIRNRIETVTA